jgi:hypothetical protein
MEDEKETLLNDEEAIDETLAEEIPDEPEVV